MDQIDDYDNDSNMNCNVFYYRPVGYYKRHRGIYKNSFNTV